MKNFLLLMCMTPIMLFTISKTIKSHTLKEVSGDFSKKINSSYQHK